MGTLLRQSLQLSIYMNFKYWNWRPLTRFTKKCNRLQMIQKRCYALKFHSTETYPIGLSHKILGYLKTKNDINVHADEVVLSNVYDFDSAIKQIQNVILYSMEPSPTEVIKLLNLYASNDNMGYHQLFYTEGPNKILPHKIEASIPFMTFSELHTLSLILGEKLRTVKLEYFSKLKRVVLEEALIRTDTATSLLDVLKYFVIPFELYGNSFSNFKEFNDFVFAFKKHIDSSDTMRLSHLMYFIGLQKKSSVCSDFVSIIERIKSSFADLSFVDAGLAINGIFRLKTNLEKTLPMADLIVDKIKKRIDHENNLLVLDTLESFALISMVKYLRMVSYTNQDLLSDLKRFLLRMEDDSFDPQFTSHIIAIYANSSFYDEEVFTQLEEKFYNFLKSPSEVVRIKDISRMMWSLSHCQHTCKNSFLELVSKKLEEFSLTGELFKFPTHVIDSTLALATLNVFNEKLLTAVLQPSILESLTGDRQSRYLSRLLVVKQVQKIVYPHLNLPLPTVTSSKQPRRTIEDERNYRPCMELIKKANHWMRMQCGSSLFELRFLVPHINYCSIMFTSKWPRETNTTTEIGHRILEKLNSLRGTRVAIDINDVNTSFNMVEDVGKLSTTRSSSTSFDEDVNESGDSFGTNDISNSSSSLDKNVIDASTNFDANDVSDANVNFGSNDISNSDTNFKVDTESESHISVNDSHPSLGANENAVGMESLKRNLLQLQGWKVKTLSPEIIQSCKGDEVALAAFIVKTAITDE